MLARCRRRLYNIAPRLSIDGGAAAPAAVAVSEFTPAVVVFVAGRAGWVAHSGPEDQCQPPRLRAFFLKNSFTPRVETSVGMRAIHRCGPALNSSTILTTLEIKT